MFEPKWKSLIANTVQPIFTPQQCQDIINVGHQQEQEEAKAQRIAEKGHDCEDNRVHGYDPEMALRDYYYCAICGPEDGLLQVG